MNNQIKVVRMCPSKRNSCIYPRMKFFHQIYLRNVLYSQGDIQTFYILNTTNNMSNVDKIIMCTMREIIHHQNLFNQKLISLYTLPSLYVYWFSSLRLLLFVLILFNYVKQFNNSQTNYTVIVIILRQMETKGRIISFSEGVYYKPSSHNRKFISGLVSLIVDRECVQYRRLPKRKNTRKL